MPKNVKQTIYGADLDITGYQPMPKAKLQEKIKQDVKDTQMFVGFHLPDKLFMTPDQYDLLANDTQRLEGSTDRLYFTGLNAMEVHVVQ